MNFIANQAESSEGSDVTVEMVTLDGYCGAKDVHQIDLLKLDVEGREYDCLLGASGMLEAGAIGCVFFETIDWAAKRAGRAVGDVEELLRKHGFAIEATDATNRIAVCRPRLSKSAMR